MQFLNLNQHVTVQGRVVQGREGELCQIHGTKTSATEPG